MVVLNNFQDIFKSLAHDAVFSLPLNKENLLEISFNDDSKGSDPMYQSSPPLLPFASSELFKAKINGWRRLTAVNDGCKAVYEISFDVKGSNFKFKAGDTIGIIPTNVDSEVSFILSHLDLVDLADSPYTLTSHKGKIPNHIPMKSTLRYVLKNCVDLRSALKKLFLLALSRHTKDQNERRILEYFCSKEGSHAYQTHILNKNLSLLDILNIFKTCKPTIQVLLSNLPRLLPRPYSIINSGLKTHNEIKICFSVISFENKKKGLTTGWLESLILKKEKNLKSLIIEKESDLESRMDNLKLRNVCDNLIPIYLRKNGSSFNLPNNLDKPIIMLGPGTGVAPYIGFLEELEQNKNSNSNLKVGETWLFFGCRNPKLDFIYEDELKGFLTSGVLTKLNTAFSRIENNGVKYIQDALKQNSKEISNHIMSGALIYICGDLKTMAAQIKDTLIHCLAESGKIREEAEQIIAQMQKEKRYFVDAWS